MEQYEVSLWVRKTLRIGLLLAIVAVPRAARAQTGSSPLYGFEVEEVWIPMKDSVRLAANLFNKFLTRRTPRASTEPGRSTDPSRALAAGNARSGSRSAL